jgi:hypothetical protein
MEAAESGEDAAPPPVPPPEQRIVEPQFRVPPYATAEVPVHAPSGRCTCCQC